MRLRRGSDVDEDAVLEQYDRRGKTTHISLGRRDGNTSSQNTIILAQNF